MNLNLLEIAITTTIKQIILLYFEYVMSTQKLLQYAKERQFKNHLQMFL